ncbi:YbaK/EbsC family protein [Pyrococcus kukulkanii]|uniref:aminoacyl-tRNA deacylase n=1 Tax=Pyrococcus kukulkanii TaxID=1609559 RepID=UPI003565BB4B
MELEEVVESLGGVIIDVGRPVKTVAQAVKATGVSPRQVIKSLVLISKRGPILAIVDGESKVSLEKVKQHFGEVRLATPEEVREITGFEVGGVPPVGINIKTVVDSRVLENEFVIGGGGRIDKLCKLDPRKIVEYQKAEIIEIRE